MHILPINIDLDLPELQTVAQKAFGNTPDASLKKWFSFTEMVNAIKNERGVCIKAVSNEGKILGLVFAQQENPINGEEGLEKWIIVLAAVDPDAAGQGVGSTLLQEIEQQAMQKSAVKMFVYTNKDDERVVNFYKKNNYIDAGYIRDYQYGKGNSAIFLLKYLR